MAEETISNKFLRKIKKDPVVPIGIAGLITTCAIGVYRYQTARKVMSTSVYLMQLRVVAQSAVVGCMTIGMLFSLYENATKYYNKTQSESKKS